LAAAVLAEVVVVLRSTTSKIFSAMTQGALVSSSADCSIAVAAAGVPGSLGVVKISRVI
jgi:hypothetical protein